MSIDFQDSLLRFLFQNKEAKAYKDYLDKKAFDIPTMQLVYGLWYDYVTKYGNIPPKANFLEFTDRAAKKSKGAVTHEVYTEMLNVIAVVYTHTDVEYEFTREIIVEYARRKGLRNLFIANADKIKNATTTDMDNIFSEFRSINNIGAADMDSDKRSPKFMFRDSDKPSATSLATGHPTFLHSLNKMTAARGFYSPQLILLMGGPKAFKTGTILSILIEYARQGLNVYIADAENGADSIRTRIHQGLLECERHEVSGYKSELKNILKRIKAYGGELVVKDYDAYIANLDNVDADLETLAIEQEWVPNIIFYDYLQLFASANKKIINKQDQIQDVYHHAIRLNKKWNTFAFTAIKVKREAVSKLVLKAEDIGVDFAQAYNCHATFALCRTEEEVMQGTARILPVLQREGTAYRHGSSTVCAVKIEEARQTIVERDAELYMEMLQETMGKGKTIKLRKYIPSETLKDE